MSIGNRRCTVVAALLATLAEGTALAAEKYEVAVIRWAPEDIYSTASSSARRWNATGS